MDIRPATDGDVPALAAVLVDAVDGSASVGFLAGLTRTDAEAYWRRVLPGADTWVARLPGGEQVVGVVADHAVTPQGQLAPTTFLVKRLR